MVLSNPSERVFWSLPQRVRDPEVENHWPRASELINKGDIYVVLLIILDIVPRVGFIVENCCTVSSVILSHVLLLLFFARNSLCLLSSYEWSWTTDPPWSYFLSLRVAGLCQHIQCFVFWCRSYISFTMNSLFSPERTWICSLIASSSFLARIKSLCNHDLQTSVLSKWWHLNQKFWERVSVWVNALK